MSTVTDYCFLFMDIAIVIALLRRRDHSTFPIPKNVLIHEFEGNLKDGMDYTNNGSVL